MAFGDSHRQRILVVCVIRITHTLDETAQPKIVLGRFTFTIWLLTNNYDKKRFFSLKREVAK